MEISGSRTIITRKLVRISHPTHRLILIPVIYSTEPFVEKCRSLAKARKLYVDAKDGDVRLAWVAHSEDTSASKIEYIDKIEASRLGIHYDLFLDAISEDRGATIIDGHYPVTKAIIERLRKVGLRQ
jgi:hypothetical protein